MHKLRERLHWWIFGVLFATTALIWYAVVSEDRGGKLTVAFLDVGQGDAIFIESPTGNQLLIDGGPDKKVLRELGKLMPFYDRTIDALLVSNPDKDHIGGFLDVLRSFKVSTLVEPGTVGASGEYQALEELIKENPSPPQTAILPLRKGELPKRVIAKRGQRFDLGGGAYFEILFPDRDVSGLDTNDGSIIGKLIYGNTSFLFLGDAPEAVENYVAQLDGKRLDTDVLKAGHHGSKTSTSEALVGFASPAMAVISAGHGNHYGHPHTEVLERLKQFEVETLGTYERGTIVMESDGETVRLREQF